MKKTRFALAQMNPTVGDFAGNSRKILVWIRKAERNRADILVFPEIALSGYPVWDLATKKRFINEGLRYLERIVKETRGKKVAVVLGVIDHGEGSDGRSKNSLVWIEKGKIRSHYTKQLLPTYDVFLENIFFEPGKEPGVISWKNNRVGLTICEDLWDVHYPDKPLEKIHKLKSDLVINISCSPYFKGVAEIRDQVIRKHAVRFGMPLVYVNQVGGQDDLIFDGRSLFVDAKGRVLFRAPAFVEDLFFFDWNPGQKDPYFVSLAPNTSSPEEVYNAIVLGLRDYCQKNGFKKVLLGLSGGIDSALTAALAVDALGSKAVLGVTMPGSYSSKGSWKDSEDLAKRLGIEFRIHPISQKYKFMVKAFQKDSRKNKRSSSRNGKVTTAMENLQARLRGLELMYLSNDENRLLLTTGNKSELAVGYCTLYGDMAGGLCVLGDVYKSDVYRLAWHRNLQSEVIPEAILTKAPSAELRPEQKDEDSLPPYEVLDDILYHYIERNKSCDDIIHDLKNRASKGMIKEIVRKVDHNEYKRRQTAPILRVTEKAWFGRRMPITNRFEN